MAFTGYHITFSEVQNLVQNNLKMMGCYIQMVDGLKQTEMCRSWLLSYLKFKDQKSEAFLPIKMATKEKQIGKIGVLFVFII